MITSEPGQKEKDTVGVRLAIFAILKSSPRQHHQKRPAAINHCAELTNDLFPIEFANRKNRKPDPDWTREEQKPLG